VKRVARRIMNGIPMYAIALLAALPLPAQQDSSGVKYGRVYVSGENPVIRLLMKEGGTPTTEASFWRVVYSPAGSGHVLFLRSGIDADNPTRQSGLRIAFTDNEKLAAYLGKEIMSAFNKVYADDPFPVQKATFRKSGNTLTEWKETVKSRKYTIQLVWKDFAEPFQLDTPAGGRTNPYGIASLFIPARAAEVIINGKKAAGRPFPTRRGRMENSTAFLAFSETWVK
jgi:hypothetical protein